MRKIVAAQLTHFRNEGHYGFMRVVLNLIAASAVVKNLVAALLATFEQLLDLEKVLVDAARKSKLTQLIKEADARTDRAINGIREAVAAGLRHYDAAVVQAATELSIRLKPMGDIAQKAYEDELSTVNVLLGELQTTFAAQVSTLNLSGWVTELGAAIVAFEDLLQQRFVETAAKSPESISSIKKQLNTCYYSITDMVNAAATLDPAAYQDFITLLNVQIEYFNEHNTPNHAQQDISKADVETIQPQAYTGEPVVVLPVVRLGGKKLAFSVDYTLTYRDNVKVGTAEVVIHGKGEFKGKRGIAFNII
jgi:hypothetical protein